MLSMSKANNSFLMKGKESPVTDLRFNHKVRLTFQIFLFALIKTLY